MKRKGSVSLVLFFLPSFLFAGSKTSVCLTYTFGLLLAVAVIAIVYLLLRLKKMKERDKMQRYYMAMRMRIARSMSNIFHTSFYVSLPHDAFIDFAVKGNDEEAIDASDSARKMLQDYADTHASPDYLQELKQFFLIDNLNEKVNPSNLYLLEYVDSNNRWSQVNMIVGDRDEKGNILHVFVGVRDIDDAKRKREAEERQMDEELSLIEGLSIDYKEVWLLKAKDMTMSLYRSAISSLINQVVHQNDQSDDYSFVRKKMVDYFVYEEDKEAVLEGLDFQNIEKQTANGRPYFIFFRQPWEGEILYRQIVVSKADTAFGDKNYVIAIRDVSGLVRQEREQQEKLAKALEEAEHSNKAKTEFFNSMSHDIRTPMNAIIGFTELAQENPEDVERITGYLEKIRTSSMHLLSLINDVLDMSRIEAGKVKLEEKPTVMDSVTRDVNTIIETDMVARRLTFDHRFQLHHRYAYVDSLRLKQVLINILSNAMKFTKPGGRIVARLTDEPCEDPRKAIYVFSISDTGVGISEEFLPHIFDPFEREDSSTISGVQGTGLGLSITKKLVDLMGGTITAESKKGEGSTFVIRIPLLLAKEEACRTEAPVTTKSVDFHGKHILLVEDNLLNQEIGQITLTEAGFLVDVASDGAVAVEKVKNSEEGYYSCILMDIQMPIMDGYEATRQIRSLENKALASIPIIAVTANAFDDAREKSFEVGMNAHLSKPIMIPELLETLGRIV